MKANLFLLLALLSTAALFPARSEITVTFDDLPDSTTGTFIASPYQGLSWSNFMVIDALLLSNASGNSFLGGMVSPPNVAFNCGGHPGWPAVAEIDACGTDFTFLSAYLTGQPGDTDEITIRGFRDSNVVYDVTKVVTDTNATLFTFDYVDIDRLVFSDFGYTPGSGYGDRFFFMDNFMLEFIPEPSSLLLTILGVLVLCAVRKRRTT